MALTIPLRSAKPRSVGLTMIIDNGVPTGQFDDLIESHGDHIDFVKFGWGTSVVTKNFASKLDGAARGQRRLLPRRHAL